MIRLNMHTWWPPQDHWPPFWRKTLNGKLPFCGVAWNKAETGLLQWESPVKVLTERLLRDTFRRQGPHSIFTITKL
jgi:hypothetical protein